MNTIQRIKRQNLLAKILFWSGQLTGTVVIIPVIIFVGANVYADLNDGLTILNEELQLVFFFLFLLGICAGLVITWFKSKTGPVIIILSSIAAGLMWGFSDLNFIKLLMLLLVSGTLLLVSGYQKEKQT